MTHHAKLREQNLNVVGMDFLAFSSAAPYSHIIANPPFNSGVQHLLHAWDIMWDGEIVFILNAETVRNQFSKERQLLGRLIEMYGEVEFVANAFTVEEAERKTEVEVALVYLRKEANINSELVGNILDGLQEDKTKAEELAAGYRDGEELAIPNSTIENAVLAFNAAVKAMRQSVMAEARANYYASLIGSTMASLNGDVGKETTDTSVKFVQNTMAKRYDELKDRSWANILRSTNVRDKLSSAAQKRLESEFENIKKFEFTVQSIYGFLCGIVESQGEIQQGMMLDVFDLITRYHSENVCFTKGWKSNDKHRTAGMKIKATRFVIPNNRTESYSRCMTWETSQMLADFDKVFAMLDGKATPTFGLNDACNHHFDSLRSGARVTSDYFDLRFFPGVGTLHFFPRNKKLIDRLNRMVGQKRKWLPPEGVRVSDAFWLAYDNAEKFDKEVRDEISKHNRNRWDNPLDQLTRFADNDERRENAEKEMDKALTTVLERHGIDVDSMLEDSTTSQGMLLLAA